MKQPTPQSIPQFISQLLLEFSNVDIARPQAGIDVIMKLFADHAGADECFLIAQEAKKWLVCASSDDEISEVPFAQALNGKEEAIVVSRAKYAGLSMFVCVPLFICENGEDHVENRRRLPTDAANAKGYLVLASRDEGFILSDEIKNSIAQAHGILINIISLLRIHRIAGQDKLTGLLNRKYLDAAMEARLKEANSDTSGAAFSIAIIDLDHFKGINDTYGHVTGDKVLAAVASAIRKCAQKPDICGRYGGEEFVVVLNNTDAQTVTEAAEKLRRAISDVRLLGDKLGVTASVGCATYPADGNDVKTLVNKADKALYVAKKDGRNCVRQWISTMEDEQAEKSTTLDFVSGEPAKDAARMQSVFNLMNIASGSQDAATKQRDALHEIKNMTGATYAALFVTDKTGSIVAAHDENTSAAQPERVYRHNEKLLRQAIETRETIYTVDWESEHNMTLMYDADWYALVITPLLHCGSLKGALYAAVSVKEKEFTPDEAAYIQNAAYIIADMLNQQGVYYGAY